MSHRDGSVGSSPDVVECRESNIMDRKKDLSAVLLRLPTNNHDALMTVLRDILQLSHLYVEDWKELHVDAPLVLRVVDLIRRYESNGLQLHGDGVRLLHKLTLNASSSHSDPTVMNALLESPVIELLLRLALEHPVYDTCLEVLRLYIARELPTLIRICEIGTVLTLYIA